MPRLVANALGVALILVGAAAPRRGLFKTGGRSLFRATSAAFVSLYITLACIPAEGLSRNLINPLIKAF